MIRRNSFRGSLGGSGAGGPRSKITVRLLDDNEVLQVDFQTQQKAQALMDYICRKLNLAEKDYFGLRYVDGHKQRHWMDLGKSVVKQLKDMTPLIVCFRFKFYPGDPEILKEQVTKYQLVLQLRRDLLHGRLYSSMDDMAVLASYIVQSELGDFSPTTHLGNYVSEYELIARQSAEFEEKVKDLHRDLVGVTAAEADTMFLKKASGLDTYGIDPFPVKENASGEQCFLGINYTGISTFHGSRKASHYKWSQINKLNYEAKMFIVHVSIPEDSRTKKKETFGFKCQSSGACKHLWRCAVEQRLFFNCGSGTEIGGGGGVVRGGGLLFGSKFKYTGKVLKEILEDPGPLRATDSVIQRTPLYRSLQRNKIRSTSSNSPLGFSTLPRSNHSAPPTESAGSGIGHLDLASASTNLVSSGSLPISIATLTAGSTSPYCPEQTLPLPLLETLEEDSPRAEEKVIDKKFWVGDSISGEGEESTSWVFEGSGTGSGDAASAPAPTASEEPKIIPDIDVPEPKVPSESSSKQPSLSRLPSIEEHEAEAAELNNNNNPEATVATNIPKKAFRKFGVSMAPDPLLINSSLLPASSAGVDVAVAPELQISNSSKDFEMGQGFGNSVSGNPSPLPKPERFTNNANAGSGATGPGPTTTPGRPLGLSIWKIFIVSMLCVLVALVVVAIISIELDTPICLKIRRIPEIEIFQTEIYDPFKGFLSTRWRSPFN